VLRNISLRDFILVGQLEVDFRPGLTVLTGETGAGKSLLVDALALALGARGEAGMIRQGAERAEISAEFDVASLDECRAWLDEAGLAAEPGECLLRRVIDAGGRSRAFINGSAVTLTQLKQIGDLLVDIHGQHAHHALLRTEVQRNLLDSYGGAETAVQQVGQAWRSWKTARGRLEEAHTLGRERAMEREALTAALADLLPAHADIEAWNELQAEHGRLSHSTALMEGCAQTLASLDEGDDPVLSRLASLEHRVGELVGFDAALATIGELISSGQTQLSEAVHELRRYADRLSLDPERLADLDRRMGEVHRLSRKHRLPPEQLIELIRDMQTRLHALNEADNVEALRRTEEAAAAKYRDMAGQLGRLRKQAGKDLARSVNSALSELALADARFEVRLLALDEPRANGMEEVGFFVSTHSGLPAGPLDKVASGGELSRISLAIQTAMSGQAGVPTLILDEVDVGIGGAVAEAVGRRLAQLGKSKQVLVITHLPQVASWGDQHLQVNKAVVDDKLQSDIRPLDNRGRVEEIARMLGGQEITPTTRRHAQEMLELAVER
jgi:DNA repair protein RecN (Recombination protein N)